MSSLTSGYVASFEPSMRLAIDLAAGTDAGSATSSDVPVGAIVLGPDEAVVGRGHNQCLATGDPTAHAEIVAIRQAAGALRSWRLDGCTLIATLEPCTMCAGALLNARIQRLVYGAARPAGRRGGLAVGCCARPQAGPAGRGHRRGAR